MKALEVISSIVHSEFVPLSKSTFNTIHYAGMLSLKTLASCPTSPSAGSKEAASMQ